MSAEVDLYCDALDCCIRQHLNQDAIEALHTAFWQPGNSILALLNWAAEYNVQDVVCPICGGVGLVTEQLEINSIVSIPTDAPCPMCSLALNIKHDQSLP